MISSRKEDDHYALNTEYKAKATEERIRFLILHFTVLPFNKALERLTKEEVSAHYLVPKIDTRGKRIIHCLVDESKVARHAGVSSWRNVANLDHTSIGIEIDNPGFDPKNKASKGEKIWIPFTDYQIDSVIQLAKEIINRYHIPPTAVLGHSDIAPDRKDDPGPLFPWEKLAKHGIGAWPDTDTVKAIEDTLNDQFDIAVLQFELNYYGYKIQITGELDKQTREVVIAFNMHFLGIDSDSLTRKMHATLKALIRKYPRHMLTIGLMSGTSMDGIDAALIDTDGKLEVKELATVSMNYNPDFKVLLKAAEYTVRENKGDLEKAKSGYSKSLIFYLQNELKILPIEIPAKLRNLSNTFYGDSKHPAPTFDEVVKRSTELHAEVVKKLLAKSHYKFSQIDVIGYHGQTLFHNPSAKITVQVGDGELLAQLTGITVVNDFRKRDVASGGQGAPFAPLYHQALAVRDQKYPVAIVNCGGIANVTVITGKTHEDVIGFDTGPGNGLIDLYIQQQTKGKESMDADGHYGSKGKINEEVLQLLHKHAVFVGKENYLSLPPPKSLDVRNNIHLIPELNKLSREDACATLEAFTADTIVNSVDYFKVKPKFWILAGGGWNNPVITHELKKRLSKKLGADIKVMTADQAGWNSKAMEAQIFAYLATRSLQNLPISVPTTTRVPQPLSGGQAHLPPSGATVAVNKLIKDNPTILTGYEKSTVRDQTKKPIAVTTSF